MKRLVLILSLLAAPVGEPVWAVQPDEMLADPAQEQRARDLSRELRCLVCRNESIDESHADLARDLRLLVRERITAGDTNEEAMAFIVDRYGEYVLLKPNTTGSNLLLWIAGPLMLMIAVGGSAIYLRRRSVGAAPDGLSDDEQARLSELMKDA